MFSPVRLKKKEIFNGGARFTKKVQLWVKFYRARDFNLLNVTRRSCPDRIYGERFGGNSKAGVKIKTRDSIGCCGHDLDRTCLIGAETFAVRLYSTEKQACLVR